MKFMTGAKGGAQSRRTATEDMVERTAMEVENGIHDALVNDHDPYLHPIANEDEDVEHRREAVEQVVAHGVARDGVPDRDADLRILIRTRLVDVA